MYCTHIHGITDAICMHTYMKQFLSLVNFFSRLPDNRLPTSIASTPPRAPRKETNDKASQGRVTVTETASSPYCQCST